MENILTQITNYLLTQSWQIAVLAAVIAAVSLSLRNKSAHVHYLLWLIVLAKCLVPPLLTIPLAILPQDQSPEPIIETAVEMPAVVVEAVDATPKETIVLPSVAVTEPTIVERLAEVTIQGWLAFGWIIGVVAFVIVAVIKALRVNFWLRRDRKPLPTELQTGIENLFAGLGLKIFPKVWLVEDVGQPFVWGLLWGSIYLPANFARVDNSERRRGVLGHELSHIMRFDAVVNLLQIIAQAIFWFHPFVWWVNKKIRAEREKCCDEMAIAGLGVKCKDYSTAIVDTLVAEYESSRPVPSLAVAGPVKNIEERIKTIMKPGKKFYKRPSIVVVIAVLLLAAIAVPTTLALTARKADKTDVQVEVEPSASALEIESAARLRLMQLEQRSKSLKKLRSLGRMLIMYTDDHNSEYPDSLEEIKPYDTNEVLAWSLENVKYLGKGKNATISPQAVIAYDKTLLKKGNGTNVLFNDAHVAFTTPKQLEKLGIAKPAIQIEARLLLAPVDSNEIKDFFEKEDLQAASININGDPNLTSYFLDDKQTNQLLKLVHANLSSKTLTAPKVMVLDGESATVKTQKTIKYEYTSLDAISEQPEQKELSIGTIMQVKPTLQADGEEMLLEIEFEHSNLLGFEDGLPQTEITKIRTRVSVPNGQTLLLGGQKITDEENGRKVLKALLCLVKAEKVKVPVD